MVTQAMTATEPMIDEADLPSEMTSAFADIRALINRAERSMHSGDHNGLAEAADKAMDRMAEILGMAQRRKAVAQIAPPTWAKPLAVELAKGLASCQEIARRVARG